MQFFFSRTKIRFMKNILLLICLIFFSPSAFAIDWQDVYHNDKKVAYVDVDSIKEYDRYYFYNIKTINVYTNKIIVITMQSKKNGGAAARINFYTTDEYDSLNGDYENITSKMTKKFEPVQFGSIAFSCYTKVRETLTKKQIQVQL